MTRIAAEMQKLKRLALSEGGLKARVLRSIALVFAGDGSQGLIQLASNLILTRILAPDIFGLMALATVLLTGMQLFTDIGVSTTVVRSRRSEDEIFLRTAWTLQAVRGVVIALIAMAAAPFVADFYEQPELELLLTVISLSVIFRSCGTIEIAMRSRQLTLGRLAVMQVGVALVTAVVTISAAWWLRSVWALAVGQLTAAALLMVVSYPLLGARILRPALERAAMREIFTFGRWVLLATVLTFLGLQGLRAVQGALVPLEVLGFIAIAAALANAAEAILGQINGRVAFPAFSEIVRDRPDELPRVLRRVRLISFALATPPLLFLSFTGQFAVDLLYDPRYAAAGGFLSLLAINSIVLLSSHSYQATQLALGASHLHALAMGVLAAGCIAGSVIGYQLGGAMGMIAGVFPGCVLQAVATHWLAARRGVATPDIDLVMLAVVTVAYGGQLSLLGVI